MPSVSSLLKSALATQEKIRKQEDAIVAFNWESSLQTYQDFVEYEKYLNQRAQETSDPSDQLTYQTKIRSARRTYTSNEIQRQQMAIMEGRGNIQTKMDSIKNLYEQALDNGDLNLAQNLVSQWDSLSIQQQNEQAQALKEYQAKLASGSSGKVAEDLLNKLTKGVDDIVLPTGQTVTPLAVIKQHIINTGDTVGGIKAAEETMEAMAGIIVDKYQNASTQEEIDKLEQDYGKGLERLYESDKLFVQLPGVGKLTYADVVDAIANDSFNNPMFGLKLTDKGYELKRNNVERIEYARTINPETGEEEYAPLKVRTDQDKLFFGYSDTGRGIKTQVTDDGAVIGKDGSVMAGTGKKNRDDSQTIENRLKELGIRATQNQNTGTTIQIYLPGEDVERTATIQPNGDIRFMEPDGTIKEIALIDRNLGSNDKPLIARAGQTRVVATDEISDFGTGSAFGGTLSRASSAGSKYLRDITGQTSTKDVPGSLKGTIRTGNDFSGGGTAVTSSLLQSAGQRRNEIQREQERIALQARAAELQASQTMNLNQTPVRQFASNGVMVNQLQVAKPTPTPRVTVAAPVKAPKVNVAKPVAQPRVTVQAPTYRASNRPSF